MKFKKILVSDDNQLVVGDYGLNENDVEIIDLNKSLHDIADDDELKAFIIQNIIDQDKIYIICVKEDFGSNEQLLEEIPDIKSINKVINKAFKKIKNIYFFVYNTYMKNESAINPQLETSITDVENDEVLAIDSPESNESVAMTDDGNDVVEENVDEFSEEMIETNESIEFTDENVDDSGIQYQEEAIAYEEPVYENEEVSEQGEQVEYSEVDSSDSSEEAIEEEKVVLSDVNHTYDENVSQDINELNEIVSNIDLEATTQDEMIRKNYEENVVVDAPEISSDEIFESRSEEIDEKFEIGDNVVNLDSVDAIAVTNNEDIEVDGMVFNEADASSVEIPETYFDSENENDITYEDYNEFVNDYELNIHTLKSAYDFIWRALVMNNHNLKLNDLLYIAVNNLDAFSIGQSDFVRQTANKAESLFDLILQLDIKLEFGNSLFYIYLAQFFTINRNKIVVNQKFLDTLSIWVDKNSKRNFIEQIEQFMNYSSIYNKKIIFSYFVELANFIKGCLPSIKPNMSLIDIHRILTNPAKRVRSENVFGFLIAKVNQIFAENGIVPEMYLVDTPENIYGVQESAELDENSESWKTQLSILYKKLVENISNYILLKGNKESDIYNIYMDIKDLRIYKDTENDKNLLSPDTMESLSQVKTNHTYATIGDAIYGTEAIVPTQQVDHLDLSTQYLNSVEKSLEYRSNTNTNELINYNSEMHSYPSAATVNESPYTRTFESLRAKYAAKFNMSEFENSMSRRIEEYERKIKDNIARIEAERKLLRQKMEDLKNI